jgi:hypothetical protein
MLLEERAKRLLKGSAASHGRFARNEEDDIL